MSEYDGSHLNGVAGIEGGRLTEHRLRAAQKAAAVVVGISFREALSHSPNAKHYRDVTVRLGYTMPMWLAYKGFVRVRQCVDPLYASAAGRAKDGFEKSLNEALDDKAAQMPTVKDIAGALRAAIRASHVAHADYNDVGVTNLADERSDKSAFVIWDRNRTITGWMALSSANTARAAFLSPNGKNDYAFGVYDRRGDLAAGRYGITSYNSDIECMRGLFTEIAHWDDVSPKLLTQVTANGSESPVLPRTGGYGSLPEGAAMIDLDPHPRFLF